MENSGTRVAKVEGEQLDTAERAFCFMEPRFNYQSLLDFEPQ